MKKKIISLLLAVVMIASMLPLSAIPAAAAMDGPQLVPDFNRDGVIDNYDRGRAMSETDAFTIWLNDDDDDAGDGDTTTAINNVPSGKEKKDYDDGVVNGRCDLLDFFPVLVNVHEVENWSELTWRIKTTGEASVNVVFTALDARNAGFFYTLGANALDGVTLHDAATTPLCTETDLPDEFLDREGEGVLLIEGSSLGEGNIVLTGYRYDSVIASLNFPIKVANVEDMYRRLNLRQGGISETDEPAARKDADSDGRQFVFVHGYNVTHDEARGEASDFYKKLWQTGSDSMFTAVEWDSDESGMDVFKDYYSFNYYANVENAFAAAEAFKNECDRLPGKKYLIGHSLGNMLICSAIQDFGLEYEKYFMLNASIAAEAFDKDAVDDGMIDDYWENNFAVSERASHWYENFGQDSDFRSTITWKGRFKDVNENVINLYSPSDEFLANCPDDADREADYNEPLNTFFGKLTGSGFWAFTEKIKGTGYIDVINELLIPDDDKTDNIRPELWMNCEGGWGINEDYVPGDSGRANTRFTPFMDERMAYEKMPFISSSEAFTLRAQLLADAIPAESYAAGSNEVSTLKNINLESYIGENWPSYTESDETGNKENLWKHNDVTDIAYYHTYKLFYDITVSPWDRLCAGKELEGEFEISVSDDVKTIKLLSDITADSNDAPFCVDDPPYIKVILDLNGHSIDFSQAGGSAIVVTSGADLTIIDSSPSQSGKIIGGTGQTIDEGVSNKLYGGGVLVLDGKLTMTGGTVTGNSADIGGGIYVAGAGELYVGGTAKIYGNLSKDGTADNNLYLQNNKYITVCTGSDGLKTGAEIGISKTGNGRISTNGAEADEKYFFSDAEGKIIKHETDGGDHLELADAQNISMTVTFDMQGGSGTSETAEARYTYTMPEITIPTKTGYTFDGYYDEYGKAYYNANGESVRHCDRQEDFTLYAHWKIGTYNIIYKDKGGDDFTGEHEIGYPTTYTYGSVTTLKRAIKISYDDAGKVRRELLDWFEDPDCSGSPVTSIGADCAKDITLYAKISSYYIERSWDEESKKVISTEKEIPEHPQKITAETRELYSEINSGCWYVVDDDVTVDGRITVRGDVHIILMNNCKLEVKGGIKIFHHENRINQLTIYAQHDGANTGRLIAGSNSGTAAISGSAGIGGDAFDAAGDITVHGGNITATGNGGGAGIGGGAVTIYGGTVTASSTYGAGIGGGGSENGNGGSGSAYIYGGTVTASSTYGAGIGGGGSENGTGGSGSANIYGGTVTASSSESVGIGGTAGCSIKITGGVVTAKSEAIQGIGVICNTIDYTIGYIDIGDNMSVYDSDDNLITLPEVAWNQLGEMSYVKLVEAGPQPLATPTADDFNFIPPNDCVYDGQPKQASVYTEKEGMGVITLKYQKYNGEGWNAATTEAPTQIGKYRVVISVEEGTNYAASAADITSDSWMFEITGKYIDRRWDEESKQVISTEEDIPVTVTDITADTTELGSGWYYLNNTVSTSKRIKVLGTADAPTCIILGDGCTLNAREGITVAEGKELRIYAQSAGTGKLYASGGTYNAGIGGYGRSGGTVSIYGGYVGADGARGAGIGGGYDNENLGCNGGTVNIFGGTITAKSADGAGIGGGKSTQNGGNGGTVNIYGGNVTAAGGYRSAGIGGGAGNEADGNGGTVNILGGTVTATGKDGSAGIGGAAGSNNHGSLTVSDTLDIYAGDALPGSKITLNEYKTNRNINVRIVPHTHDFTGEYKDNGNGTHSHKCTECDEYGATEAHTFVNHECVCGATNNHDFTGEYKNNGDGTHSRKCTECDEYGATEAHTWQSVDKNTHKCTVCDTVENHTDSNKDSVCDECEYVLCYHENIVINYTWGEDYQSCTATKHCNDCGNDILTENATEIKLIEDTHGANCQTMGKGHYEATFATLGTAKTAENGVDTTKGEHHYIDFICEYCQEEDLEGAKANAIDELAAAIMTDLSDEVYERTIEKLNAATTVEEVEAIKNAALAEMKEADALYLAKRNAIVEITAAKTETTAAIADEALDNIRAATTVEAIEEIRDEALAKMKEAMDELAAAKLDAVQAIIAAETENNAAFVEMFLPSVFSATTVEQVTIVKVYALLMMDIFDTEFGAIKALIAARTDRNSEIANKALNEISKLMDNIGEKIYSGLVDGTVEEILNAYKAEVNAILEKALADMRTADFYAGMSLTLGSDIAINFYVELSEEARQNGTMTFDIGGRIVTLKGTDAKWNETEKKYYFQTPLTALEMNETVKATFTYNGVDYVQEYSVERYIDKIVSDPDKYGEKAVALAKKIANYGHYAQIYLESIHTNVHIVDSGDGYDRMIHFDGNDDIRVDAAIEALANYSVKVTGTSNNISLYGSTVYFDSATALNYYVTVENGTAPTATAVNKVTGKSKDVEIKLYKDKIYIVSVKDITATELADDIEVKINNDITLTGSVFAYCNSVVKAHSDTDGKTDEQKAKDEKAVNAMAAFYEYYEAACEYAKTQVQK